MDVKSSIKLLTSGFFKSEDNYYALFNAAVEKNITLDSLSISMARLYDKDKMECIHIPHLHQVTDEDGRSLRNMLLADNDGSPLHHSRNYDLLQYVSMCMQYENIEYAAYVQNWCERQVLCLDDPEDDD